MSHEQSETIQNARGKWINVYGRNVRKDTRLLPGSKEYETVDEAVDAAKKRSHGFGLREKMIRGRGY